MVLPNGEISARRVRVVRDSGGRFIGFQDPDAGGRFITRDEAASRLRFSVEEGALVDSFGAPVGVGGITLPRRGVEVGYKLRSASYKPLDTEPARFKPGANQELIERVYFTKADGSLVSLETSYGLGRDYDPHRTGGRWRQAASEALGLKEGQRLPTRDLQRAVIMKEFIVKTIK